MKKNILLLVFCCLSIVSYGTTYYSKPSSAAIDATVLGNWTTNTGGTGTVPLNFTSGDTWIAQTAGGLSTSKAWVLTGTLQINASATISIASTITGSITVNSGGILNLFTNTVISALGDITVNGTLNVSSGTTLTMGSTYSILGTTGLFTGSGTISTANTSATAMQAGRTWGGTVIYTGASGGQTIANGTYNNLTCNGSATQLVNGSGNSLTVNGIFTLGAGTTLNLGNNRLLGTLTTVTIDNTATLNTSVAAFTVAIPINKTWGGTIQYNASSGSQTVSSGTYNNLVIGNSSGSSVANGNVTVTGALTTTSGGTFDLGSSGILNVASATINNNGILKTEVLTSKSTNPISSGKTWGGEVQYSATGYTQTVAAGNYNNLSILASNCTANGSINVNGTLNITSLGVLNMGSSYSLGGTLATVTNAGTIKTATQTSTSSTPLAAGVTWGGTGIVQYYSTSGNQTIVPGTYNNLTLSNTSGINSSGGDVTLNNTLVTTSGGTWDLGTNLLLGSFTPFVGGSGMIQTENTSSTPIPNNKSWSQVIQYHNATGGQSIVPGTYRSLYNNISSGTNTLTGDVTVINNFKLVSGTVNDGGHTITMTGQLTGTGTHTGSGLINYFGTDSATTRIEGVTVGNIQINNGVSNRGRLNLAGNFTVTGTMTLNGMSLHLGTYNLIIQNGASIAGSISNSNMIIADNTGYLQMFTNGTGSLFYPIGDSNSHYTPITLNYTAGTFSSGSAHVDVNVVASKHPSNGNSNNYLNRYWNVTSTGITAPTFNITSANYAVTDIVGSESSVTDGEYSGSLPWHLYDAANTGSHVLTGTGLSGTTLAITGISGTPPSVTAAATTGTICNGSSTTVYVSASAGDNPLTYVWAPSASLSSSTGTSVTASPTSTQTYTVTITDGNGVTATSTVTVTVENTPNPGSITGAGNICLGSSIGLSSTGDASGIWSSVTSAVATINPSTGSLSTVTAGTSVISYSLTNSCGTFAATATETVNALPSVSFTTSPGANVCASNDVTYSTQSSQSNYTWSVPGVLNTDYSITTGGTGTGSSTVTLQWLTSGSKTVTVNYTDGNGCSATSPASNTTTVNSLPSVSFTASPGANSCASNNVIYTTQASQSNYTWSVPGVLNADYSIISGGTGTGSSTVTLQWLTTGSKTVTVNYADGNGCGASVPASNTTTVNSLPSVSFTLSPGANVCASNSVTYTTQASQSNYSWSVPGILNTDYSIISGGTGTSDNTVTLQWLMSGIKTVTVNYTDGNGCSASSPASNTTTAHFLPSVSYTASPGANVCASNNVTYTTQSSQSNYTWIVPGVLNTDYLVISGGTGTGSSTVTLQWLTSGSKTVTVNYSDVNSCSALSPASNTTTVNSLPIVGFTASPGANSCASNNIIYTTQASQSNYTWSVPGVLNTDYSIISGGTGTGSSTVTLQWLTTGSKTVTVNYADGNGCGATSPASNTTIVHTLPSVSFTSSPGSSICASNNVIYTTQASQSNYSWSVPGVLNTDYSIISGGIGTSNNTVTLQWLTSGSKTVTVNYADGNGCGGASPASNNTAVFALPSVSFTASPGANICESNNVTYTTQSSQFNYSWSVPGVLNTDYSIISGGTGTGSSTVTLQWLTSGSKTVTVNYNNSPGCSALSPASNTTTVNSLPSVSFTSSPGASSCASNNVTYTTQSSQSNYTWSVPGVLNTDYSIISGGTGTGSSTVTLQWLTTGSKTVTVNYSNAGGCSALSAASNTTNVNVIPTATFTSSPGASICSSTNTTYTTQGSQSNYTWTVPGVLNTDYSIISGGIGTGSNSVTLQWLTSGSKTVTVNYNNSFGCSSLSAASSTVTANLRPSVSFTASASAISCISFNVVYTTQASESNYTWSVPGVLNTDYTISSGGTGTGSNTVTLQWLTTGTKVVSINYTDKNGCTALSSTTNTTTVNVLPGSIAGTASVCNGSVSTLSVGTPNAGGAWSSSATGIATVNPSTGAVTGISVGSANISYTMSGCYRYVSFAVKTVPAAISAGATTICISSTTSLTDATSSGTWTSSSPSVASINSSGLVTGATAGATTISYNYYGCYATQPISVTSSSVSAITGTLSVCATYTTSLSDATGSGAWSVSSGSSSYASVDVSGVVTGIAPGTATISYTLFGGCFATAFVTVNGAAAITGASSLCTANVTTLADATTGGAWSSGATGIATINSSGIVTGVAAGTAPITYAKSGCNTITNITVTTNTLAAVTGAQLLCSGSTTQESDATPGGSWSSSNTSVATVNSSGLVTGVSPGGVNITYTGSGCYQIRAGGVTIGTPLSITGSNTVCSTYTTTLSNNISGGSWVSSQTAKATINSSGVVTGVASGTTNISYSKTGCTAVLPMTVNANPAAITGTASVCVGANTTLSDASGAGTWTSSNGSLATVNSSGAVTGVAAGSPIITFTLTSTGCFNTQAVTVSSCPRIGNYMNGQAGGSNTFTQTYLVYPNPSNGKITIEQGIVDNTTVKFRIINYLGVTTYTGNIDFSGVVANIDLTNNVPGMYVVEITDDAGSIATFKIAIEK